MVCNCAETGRHKKHYEIRYELERARETRRYLVETDDPIEFDAHLAELIRSPDGGRIVTVRMGTRMAVLCWLTCDSMEDCSL